MAVETVYVLGGGEYMTAVLNGVVGLLGTSSWDSMMRIVMLISGLALMIMFMRRHDPMEIVKFVMMLVVINSVLLVPKRTVQVIDRTNPLKVYTVDNVPVGIAAPARFITSIGVSIAETFELFFHTPDSATYSKTGMLFGAELVGSVGDIFTTNGDLAELMGGYVKNCVVGDILLNHKYSFQELMNSTDPYTLIFRQPSPLRGVMVPYGNSVATRQGFWTCEALAKQALIPALGLDTATGGATWEYYARRVLGGRPDANILFGSLLSESYNYYYQGGQTASQVMRSSVVMNAIRQGLSAYSAQSGDAASLINLASTTSYNKMRLSWGTSTKIGTVFVPLLNTILLVLVIGLFPIMILLACVHGMTVGILKNYVFSIIYLQTWAPMFAILNLAMNLYLKGKTGNLDFSLSNMATIQQTHSDIGLIAGNLIMSIPILTIFIVKGLANAWSSAGSSLASSIGSSASATASNASDGQWAFNNMQMDNVQGRKWDTNYGYRDGQMTRQLASGATSTRTVGGDTVFNTTEAQSRLATEIQVDKMASSSFQRSQREAMNEAQSLSNSISHTASLGATQLAQWGQQRGSSDTLTQGTDSSQASNLTSAMNTLKNITSRYARDNRVTDAEAVRSAMEKSQNMAFNAGASGQVRLDTDKQLIGAAAKLGTGLSLHGEAHIKADYTGNSGSSHGTSADLSRQSGNSKDYSAQELKDIRKALDVINSQRLSTSGSHAQNESGSLVNQVASTFSDLQSQVSQYNDAVTRSHEYAQMANYVENNSASIRGNYTQEFVGYVNTYRGQDAERLLSNAGDPAIRAEREQLAQQFVEEKLKPELLREFAYNQMRSAEGMGGVDNTTGAGGDLQSQFAGQQRDIQQTAQAYGVQDVGVITGDVEKQRQTLEKEIGATQNKVKSDEKEVDKSYTILENEHRSQSKQFDDAKNSEVKRQADWFGDNSGHREKLNEIKKNMGNVKDDLINKE